MSMTMTVVSMVMMLMTSSIFKLKRLIVLVKQLDNIIAKVFKKIHSVFKCLEDVILKGHTFTVFLEMSHSNVLVRTLIFAHFTVVAFL